MKEKRKMRGREEERREIEREGIKKGGREHERQGGREDVRQGRRKDGGKVESEGGEDRG